MPDRNSARENSSYSWSIYENIFYSRLILFKSLSTHRNIQGATRTFISIFERVFNLRTPFTHKNETFLLLQAFFYQKKIFSKLKNQNQIESEIKLKHEKALFNQKRVKDTFLQVVSKDQLLLEQEQSA